MAEWAALRVEVEEELGRGASGVVYKATARRATDADPEPV